MNNTPNKQAPLALALAAALVSIASFTALPAQAEGKTPTLLRNDISIRKVGEAGAGMMRLDKDPGLNDVIFFLDSQGNISEMSIKNGTSKVIYSHREIGGAD